MVEPPVSSTRPALPEGTEQGVGVMAEPSPGCPDEAQLLAFLEGESSRAERAAMEAHLNGCSDCRRLVSVMAPGHGGERARRDEGLPAVKAGDLVADKYRIDRIIGQGGMGVVVAGRHMLLDRPVALKFLRASLAEDPRAATRFVREARAAAAIDSEHVVRVLDVGHLPDSGELYLVLELLNGNDLAEEVRRRGALPVTEVAGYMIQACKALALAHARGIIHRDIKPANLFLTRRDDGSPLLKVLDFGIAKFTDPRGDGPGLVTSADAILGSPCYMAPEQLEGRHEIDARADVWALGVVIFELLTARLPFEATSIASLCAAILTAPPPRIREIRSELPEALEAMLLRCLAKDPAERTASVEALAAELSPFASAAGAAGVSVAAAARDARPAEEGAGAGEGPVRIGPGARARRVRAGLAAIGLLVAVLGVSAALLRGSREAPSTEAPRNEEALRASQPANANASATRVEESAAKMEAPAPALLEAAPARLGASEPSAAPPARAAAQHSFAAARSKTASSVDLHPSPPSAPTAAAASSSAPVASSNSAPGSANPLRRDGLLDRK